MQVGPCYGPVVDLFGTSSVLNLLRTYSGPCLGLVQVLLGPVLHSKSVSCLILMEKRGQTDLCMGTSKTTGGTREGPGGTRVGFGGTG